MPDHKETHSKSFFSRLTGFSFRRASRVELPDSLFSRALKQYLVAVLVAAFAIGLCVMKGDARYLLGAVFSFVFVMYAITDAIDYDEGRILELPMRCVSSSFIMARKATRVVFCTESEPAKYYEFFVPGAKTTDYIPDALYVVYFNPDKPKTMLGATQL